MNPKRRRILVDSAIVAASVTLGLPTLAAAERHTPRKVATDPDVYIELTAAEGQVAILPGKPTRVWHYRGKLLRGNPSVLEAVPNSYLGPIIRVRRGQRVRIDFINELPESTNINFHGLHVPAAMDGHPRDVIATGERFRYDFTILNRAGSYFYHPHPHGHTGKEVYFGLGGLFLVSDEEEEALGLPDGAQDLPLAIQDRSFDSDNQFVYLSQRVGDPDAHDPEGDRTMGGSDMGGMMGGSMMGGGMMARMMGVFGDQILVNGRPHASLEVEARPYRLRLYNVSNSRIYKLAWSDGTPLTAIANDGGLLAEPLQRNYITLAPAERADIWVDFGHWPVGTELTLQSLAFEGTTGMDGMMGGGGMMNGMMGRMMSTNALPDGTPFPILKLRVKGVAKHTAVLPKRLSNISPPNPRLAANFGHPKIFDDTMRAMRWGINGRSFEMSEVDQLETVKLGTYEIWEFRNDTPGMMAHAMHVLGRQFRVLERSIDAGFAQGRDTVKAGYLDEGWKDTVLVMPGERVRILLHFADFPGLFIYQCHMLEHADDGLMRNYLIEV